MGNDEVIKMCSVSTGLSQKNVRIVLESVLTIIKNQVSNGEDVNLKGFGKFTAVEHKSKQCHNPNNPNEIIQSDPIMRPKFKAAKDFQTIVGS